jgi:peptidoglycan hydrolase CwlO-like protein
MIVRFSFSKILVPCLFLLAGLLLVVNQIQAQECTQFNCSSGDQECLSDQVSCLNNAINNTQQQAKTLKNAISVLNGQISLQQLQVNQTLYEINQLETEINELTERIEGLGYSLDRLGSVLIERVKAQYKQSRTAPELRLLGAASLSDLVNQMKYLLLAQHQTADAMERTETQRQEFDEQKQLKEEKQAQLDVKRRQLETEKAAVTQKRAEQQDLLNFTNNSEQQYQRLLSQANSQLASFSRFASSLGVSLLSGQTSCNGWGCYYSQRDSQWGGMYMGGSSYTVAQAGCLITSVAMVSTHYGKSLTPGQIASNSSVFAGADMKHSWSVNGVSINLNTACSSSSCLDSVLEGGNPAVVRLTAANFAGTHFIVILEKKDGQYIMHDPAMANGNDKKFTDHYALGSITRVDRVSVN